jgi:DnaJ like chaperone protein
MMGLLLGHLHDSRGTGHGSTRASSSPERDFFQNVAVSANQRSIFSVSVIVLGAKLAKIDGPVTREEILAFRQAFHTSEEQLDEVGHMFNNARASSDGYEPYAARLAQIFAKQPTILEETLVGLFLIARADSTRLARSEILFLRRVAVLFGFDEETFTRLAARAGIYLTSAAPPPKQDSAYDVLSLPTTATAEVIKKTYRALVRKYHPDKLLAAGLPASRVAEATEKIKRINAAYSEICKMRGIK